MAVTYGFFNSINHDRVYNADQMSTYFKGLISQGVFENVGGALQVTASDGLTVQVQTGRAIIGDVLKWVENDTIMNLTINPAHVTLNRYTAVIIRCDINNRVINITTKNGANATNPTKPNMANTATMKELCLAYIYVKAGTTVIRQADIQDTRPITSLCGWVTGLIDQVDTTHLYAQWNDAYNNYYNEMTAGFNEWFDTLTGQLSISTYIQKYEKTVVLTDGDSKIIPLDMNDYVYNPADIFLIYFNGLEAIQGTDYSLNTSVNPVTLNINMTPKADNTVDIKVLQSKIGFYVLGNSNGQFLATNNNEVIMG